MMSVVVSEGPAVLVFTGDGDVLAFVSPEDAASWMEAVDVEAGEYREAFAVDGRVAAVNTVLGEGVAVTVTSEIDAEGLRGHLEQAVERLGLSSSATDPVAVANELLRGEWERRWPKRPRWLATRLHGTEPPQV